MSVEYIERVIAEHDTKLGRLDEKLDIITDMLHELKRPTAQDFKIETSLNSICNRLTLLEAFKEAAHETISLFNKFRAHKFTIAFSVLILLLPTFDSAYRNDIFNILSIVKTLKH